MHKGKLEAISFCFPSGWIPTEVLGKDFAFLHEPVADNDLLISRVKNYQNICAITQYKDGSGM